MLRVLLFLYTVFVLNLFGVVENEILTIPLFRQKTPRESIMNTDNIPEHGIFLDWLKPHRDNRTNDTISLQRFLDSEFYGQVVVGSPGKTMNVIFDTAWATSWFMSKKCSIRTVGCWFHRKYNHDGSSSYRPQNKSFIVDEGTYNLTGFFSNDNISIAHSKVNQTFVEMTDIPYWYIFSKADGVIGLGLKNGDTNPFFYNLRTQTNITKPIFCIFLNRDKSSSKGGSIFLGGIETKHIHVTNEIPDNITYVPINAATGLWEFNMNSVSLDTGNKTFPLCVKNCKGLADTSSNTITTSKEYLDIINDKIGAQYLAFGRYKVDCDTVNKLPFIDFIIGGNKFMLTGKEYSQKLSLGPVTLCLSAFTASSTTSEANRWIMGGAFLSKFYSIYDVENKQVGFVTAA